MKIVLSKNSIWLNKKAYSFTDMDYLMDLSTKIIAFYPLYTEQQMFNKVVESGMPDQIALKVIHEFYTAEPKQTGIMDLANKFYDEMEKIKESKSKMKIKISKSQWEETGRKAGWLRVSKLQDKPQKWTNGTDEYILLPDGTLEINTQEISDLVEDKRLARIMWNRKEYTKETKFCSECGTPDPKTDKKDYTVPGMQKPESDMREGTICCDGELEDKYGNKI